MAEVNSNARADLVHDTEVGAAEHESVIAASLVKGAGQARIPRHALPSLVHDSEVEAGQSLFTIAGLLKETACESQVPGVAFAIVEASEVRATLRRSAVTRSLIEAECTNNVRSDAITGLILHTEVDTAGQISAVAEPLVDGRDICRGWRGAVAWLIHDRTIDAADRTIESAGAKHAFPVRTCQRSDKGRQHEAPDQPVVSHGSLRAAIGRLPDSRLRPPADAKYASSIGAERGFRRSTS